MPSPHWYLSLPSWADSHLQTQGNKACWAAVMLKLRCGKRNLPGEGGGQGDHSRKKNPKTDGHMEKPAEKASRLVVMSQECFSMGGRSRVGRPVKTQTGSDQGPGQGQFQLFYQSSSAPSGQQVHFLAQYQQQGQMKGGLSLCHDAPEAAHPGDGVHPGNSSTGKAIRLGAVEIPGKGQT